jgi:hypothetical protein
VQGRDQKSTAWEKAAFLRPGGRQDQWDTTCQAPFPHEGITSIANLSLAELPEKPLISPNIHLLGIFLLRSEIQNIMGTEVNQAFPDF